MTEINKTLSGRGGKREGAGRPFAEKPKKMFSFRLSEEEEKAVRELLAKMRGKLVILFCLLSLCLPSYAAINGSVEYTENNARQEAFQGVYKYCPFPDKISLSYSTMVSKFDESLILSMQQTENGFVDVVYKAYPNFTYSYKYKKAHFYDPSTGYICNHIYVKYNNKISVYHALMGKLLAVGLTVSPQEAYIFDMNGNVIGHKKGNKIEKAKINLFEMKKIIYSEQ